MHDDFRIDPDNPDPAVIQAAGKAKTLEQPPDPGTTWSLAWDRDGRRASHMDWMVATPMVVSESTTAAAEEAFEPFPLTGDPASFRDLEELVAAYRACLERDPLRVAVRVPEVVAVLELPSRDRATEIAIWYGLTWSAEGPAPSRGPFTFRGEPAAVAALLRAVTA